jgi:hypothetical protein
LNRRSTGDVSGYAHHGLVARATKDGQTHFKSTQMGKRSVPRQRAREGTPAAERDGTPELCGRGKDFSPFTAWETIH